MAFWRLRSADATWGIWEGARPIDALAAIYRAAGADVRPDPGDEGSYRISVGLAVYEWLSLRPAARESVARRAIVFEAMGRPAPAGNDEGATYSSIGEYCLDRAATVWEGASVVGIPLSFRQAMVVVDADDSFRAVALGPHLVPLAFGRFETYEEVEALVCHECHRKIESIDEIRACIASGEWPRPRYVCSACSAESVA